MINTFSRKDLTKYDIEKIIMPNKQNIFGLGSNDYYAYISGNIPKESKLLNLRENNSSKKIVSDKWLNLLKVIFP